MADSVSSVLGDEKETDNEDKESEKAAFRSAASSEIKRGASELTETLGFYEKKAKNPDKRSVSVATLQSCTQEVTSASSSVEAL